jgi:hypothetical protein
MGSAEREEQNFDCDSQAMDGEILDVDSSRILPEPNKLKNKTIKAMYIARYK